MGRAGEHIKQSVQSVTQEFSVQKQCYKSCVWQCCSRVEVVLGNRRDLLGPSPNSAVSAAVTPCLLHLRISKLLEQQLAGVLTPVTLMQCCICQFEHRNRVDLLCTEVHSATWTGKLLTCFQLSYSTTAVAIMYVYVVIGLPYPKASLQGTLVTLVQYLGCNCPPAPIASVAAHPTS